MTHLCTTCPQAPENLHLGQFEECPDCPHISTKTVEYFLQQFEVCEACDRNIDRPEFLAVTKLLSQTHKDALQDYMCADYRCPAIRVAAPDDIDMYLLVN